MKKSQNVGTKSAFMPNFIQMHHLTSIYVSLAFFIVKETYVQVMMMHLYKIKMTHWCN